MHRLNQLKRDNTQQKTKTSLGVFTYVFSSYNEVSVFELQSCNCVHLRTYTLYKRMRHLIASAQC